MRQLLPLAFLAITTVATPKIAAATFNVSDEAGFRAALATAGTNGQDDVINMAAGTYHVSAAGGGTFVYTGASHALRIAGAGMGATVIDGDGLSDVLILSGVYSGPITLENLTITRARGEALYVYAQLITTVSGVEFRDNVGTDIAVAYVVGDQGVSFHSNVFVNNEFSNAGGVHGGIAYIGSPGTTSVTGNVASDNRVETVGNLTAGVFRASGSRLTFSGNSFARNTVEADGSVTGGVVYAAAPNQIDQMNDNLFVDNSVSSGGELHGGVWAINASLVTVSGARLEGNEVTATGALTGGVMHIWGHSPVITGSALYGNTVTAAGPDSVNGGILSIDAQNYSGHSRIEISRIHSNSVAESGSGDLQGGLMYLRGSGPSWDLTVSGNAVIDNVVAEMDDGAARGGALFAAAEDVATFVQNTITRNTLAGTPDTSGGGIYLANARTADLYNNIVWANSADSGADICIAAATAITLSNNDYASLANTSGAVPNNSGNLNIDPMLAPGIGEFHLRTGSPMVDAGTPAAPWQTATDLDGQSRTIGAAPDIGADEFLAAPPQANNDSVQTTQNTPANFNVLTNDSDANGDPITIVSTTAPGRGDVICNFTTGDCTYTPDPGYSGPDSFRYTVSAGGATDTASVGISILQTSATPSAQDDAATASGGTAVVNVLTNDTDPENDPLTVTSYTQPSNGTVTCTPAGVCTYTANNGFTGIDAFTYTVSDGTSSDTATVTVTVAPAAIPTAGEWALLMLAALLGAAGVMRAR